MGNTQVAEEHVHGASTSLIRRTNLPDGKVDQMEKLTAPGPQAWKHKISRSTPFNQRKNNDQMERFTEIAKLPARVQRGAR